MSTLAPYLLAICSSGVGLALGAFYIRWKNTRATRRAAALAAATTRQSITQAVYRPGPPVLDWDNKPVCTCTLQVTCATCLDQQKEK